MSEKFVYLPMQLENNSRPTTNYNQFKSQLEKKIKRRIKKFAYQDEDGDFVSITNDLEFQELFRGYLQEEIHLQAVIEGAESVEVHSAYCDSCGSTIVGIRYKCANCVDYDLCEECESVNGGDGSIHPKDHLFLKVYHVLNPQRPQVVLPNLFKEACPENSALPEIQGRLSAMEKQLSQIVSQLAPKDQVHNNKPKPVNLEKVREERKKRKMLRREAKRKEKEEVRQGSWRCDARRQREMQERRLREQEERVFREEAARMMREEEERRIIKEEEEARMIKEEEEARRLKEEAEAKRIKEEEARRIKEEEEARRIEEEEEEARMIEEEEEEAKRFVEEEVRKIREEEARKIREEEEAEEREERERMNKEEEARKIKEEEEKKIEEEEKAQEEKIDPQMEQLLTMLNSMGFTDRALNLRLLKEHGANIALVIEELLV